MGIVLNLPLWTFLLVTSTCLLIPVDSQFQRMPEDSGCGAGTTCVLITECPRLLDILKQVLFTSQPFQSLCDNNMFLLSMAAKLSGTSSLLTVHPCPTAPGLKDKKQVHYLLHSLPHYYPGKKWDNDVNCVNCDNGLVDIMFFLSSQ